MPVGAVQLMQVPLDRLLVLLLAPLHLRAREVPVPGVDRLELGTVDRHACLGKQTKLAAERTNRAQTLPIAGPLSLRKSAIVL